MSKFYGAQFSVLLVDGYNVAASISEAVMMSMESLTQQSNPFGVGNESHTPMNLEKVVLNVGGGFYDVATDALNSALGGISHAVRIVCAAVEDNIIGRHFWGFQGAYTQKYTVLDRRDGITMADVDYLISGDVDEGVIVQHLSVFTADWDTKTGGANAPDAPVDYTIDTEQRVMGIGTASKAAACVIVMITQHGSPIAHGLTTGQKILISGNTLSGPAINGIQTVTVISTTSFSVAVNTSGSTGTGSDGTFVLAATTAGGVGYLEVTAYTGFTGFINKIMHSPDDITYAALITFTDLAAVAGPAKERKTVAGTVDRYLSNNGDVTGAGSITVFAGFARN